MSDRETSGDASKDCEQTADYALKLELSTGTEIYAEFVHVHNHSLRSGFMVIEYAGGEQWFRASDVVRLTKSYM